MNILAIESSCDETAAAIISGDPKNPTDTPKILSNIVVSQIDIFAAYGEDYFRDLEFECCKKILFNKLFHAGTV